MITPTSHPCTHTMCDGSAFKSTFLIPAGEPNTMKPGQLWECNTCGALWNLDGTPYVGMFKEVIP